MTGDPTEVMQRVHACLEYVVNTMLANEDPDTTAQLYVSNDGMLGVHRASKLAKIRDLNISNMMGELEKVKNSIKAAKVADGELEENEDEFAQIFWDECSFVLVLRKKRPHASGTPYGRHLYNRAQASPEEYAKWASSLRDPAMKGYSMAKCLKDSCLLNCTALGLERTKHENWRASDCKAFISGAKMKKAVQELAKVAGVPFKGPHDIAILGPIQQHFGDEYQLAVYKGPEEPIHTFGPNTAPHHVNLFFKEGEDGEPSHVMLITSMSGFFGARKFCEDCKRTAGKQHKCSKASCRVCMCSDCPAQSNEPRIIKQCDVCNKAYRTESCFTTHTKTGRCSQQKLCLLCGETFKPSCFEGHPCGKPLCKDICNKRHSPFETCYVPTGASPEEDEAKEGMWDEPELPEGKEYRPAQQSDPSPQPSQDDKGPQKQERCRIYGDAETSCDPKTGQLTASLLIFKKVYPQGSGKEPEWFTYHGPRAAHDFLCEARPSDSPFRHSTVWFHNGSKFDAHLLWKAAVECQLKPDIKRKGGKIIQMDFGSADLKVKDTLLFLPGVPLSKFPALFGLESGDKGHYPYKLTGTELVDGEGNFLGLDGTRFPSFEDFLPDGVRPKAYRELRAWWDEESAKYQRDPSLRYNLKAEEERYCRQDVDILAGGFEVFREQCLAAFGADINDSLTLPQFINRVYRKNFMKPKSISPLPPQGFLRENNRGSVEAFGWMQLKRRELREQGRPLSQLRDARRGGEVRVQGLGVCVYGTGVDSTGMRHVFQFHGCWWHGCPRCAERKGKPRSEGQQEKYAFTLEQSARLNALSSNPDSPYGPFIYYEVWEHDFLELVSQGPAKAYWTKFRKNWPKEQLRLRQAFHWGRTNAVMHKIKVPKGWSLHYVDFTSLYPSINYGATGEVYPVGAPKIFIGPDMEEEPDMPKLEEAFGFWKVKVHPPRQLYFPVLPMSVNSKLVFPLCRTCAEEERQGLCTHSREERALSGTYFTEELKKAVELGYELDTPQEVYEWPKEQRTGQMFKKFIRELYAMKVLSSAKPETAADMEAVLEDVRTSVGLRLHPEDFKENSCQRAQAKFCLNNIWGFHGKTGQPSETQIVQTSEQLEKLECNPDIEITDLLILPGDESLMVKYRNRVEKTWNSGSMAVAAMTTGWARLRLYEVLQEYEQHVAYFDTDSAFLLLPPGVAPPPTSSKLGGLKDEIEETYGKGAYISWFISLGPKTYAYQVKNKAGRVIATEFKVKGVSLTKAALEKVSMERMGDLLEDKASELRLKQWNITRDMVKCGLYSRHFTKRLGFSSTKRFFLPEGDATFKKTLPFGYTYDHRDPQETQTFLNLFPKPQ